MLEAAFKEGAMDQNRQGEPMHMVAQPDDLSESRMVGLVVQGMRCISCETRVRDGLLALEGVVSADVDWETGLAFVDFIPAKTNVDTIRSVVSAAGNDEQYHYLAYVITS
jgi:copper chaperone CopZ